MTKSTPDPLFTRMRFLHVLETGSQAHEAIGDRFNLYNTERPHSTLNGRTPHEAYNGPYIQPATPAAA